MNVNSVIIIRFEIWKPGLLFVQERTFTHAWGQHGVPQFRVFGILYLYVYVEEWTAGFWNLEELRGERSVTCCVSCMCLVSRNSSSDFEHELIILRSADCRVTNPQGQWGELKKLWRDSTSYSEPLSFLRKWNYEISNLKI